MTKNEPSGKNEPLNLTKHETKKKIEEELALEITYLLFYGVVTVCFCSRVEGLLCGIGVV